jgi:predicted transcriptional regulator
MKDTRLNIRISSELKEQAQKLAEADGRDLTNWVTWLIRKEMERKEIEKAAEK